MKLRTIAIAFGLLTSALPAFAVKDLRVQVQAPNVVLTWPSQPGAAYIVQYRPTLTPETIWTALANNHPASAGQLTTFTHVGIFTCPPMAAGR